MGSNICKFVAPTASATLTVSCFVRETDKAIMEHKTELIRHRAILFTDGDGRALLDDSEEPYRRGTLLFCFSGETFSLTCDSETAYIYVDFDGNRFAELCSRFDIGVRHRAYQGFDDLIPMWNESLAHASEHTVDLAAESVLLYTFSRMQTADDDSRGIIGRVLKITEERFTDPKLTMSAIAEELFYNSKYLSHIFKDKMGVSYSDYLCELRIKQAVFLFRHGIDSVKNVALLSGFSDPLYFSTVFKKSTGLSPSEYKKEKFN